MRGRWKPLVLAAFLLLVCLCEGAARAETPPSNPVQEAVRLKHRPAPPVEAQEAQTLPRASLLGSCTITYYDTCEVCCGKSDGITRSGAPAVPYETCAVDPEIIPLGSAVVVDYGGGELHYYRAEDTGGGVKGNHIDICVTSHEEAQQLGIKEAEVYWIMAD